MKKIFDVDAIKELVGGSITRQAGGIIKYGDGQTPPSQADIDAKVISMQAEYDALAYARSRQAEYPDWGVQLEKIDDDGLTRWREEMIDPVKSKWPKDNSGPK